MKKINLEYALREGAQTKITPLALSHAKKIKKVVLNPEEATAKEPYLTIYKTNKYISDNGIKTIDGFNSKGNAAENRKIKDKIFRKRSLDQILKDGYYPTCSDIGLLFRGLLVAQGIPALYIETFHEDYLFDRSFHGHVITKVFDGKKSFYVDPSSNPKLIFYKNESEIFPYVIYKEGLDSWDVNISSYEDMHKCKEENLKLLIKKYQLMLKKNYELKNKEAEDLLKQV